MNVFPGFLVFVLMLIFVAPVSAQVCNGDGNIVIFANYDGGNLNINVDQDIPNLKIGICTYEACVISITGTYVGNVTEVIYAGFNSYNNHCDGPDIGATTITGVPSGITSILFAPPATLADSDGYPSIICAYSCLDGSQGGCNTAEQIVDYFVTEFNGTMFSYFTQYGCWAGPYNISAGGNCCPGATPEPVSFFSVSDAEICATDCVTFTDLSSGIPESWSWVFEGGQPGLSTSFNPPPVCYDVPGTYDVTLTVTNDNGNDTYTTTITVLACAVGGCTYTLADNYNPNATVDDGTCTFNNLCDESCDGDFDGNGVVNVADLLDFIQVFGTLCE